MKTLKSILLTILFYIFLSISSILFASPMHNTMISVEFDNLPLSEVLLKLRDASGVGIVLNRAIDRERLINKKYNNRSLDDIVLDIFRYDNITASFRYSDKKLTSIGIWMLPRVKGGDIKPVLSYESRESGDRVNEIKTDVTTAERRVNTAKYKNIKRGSDSEEMKINTDKEKTLNNNPVYNTGSGAYYANAGEDNVTQYKNKNNYANNEAVIDAISKGTTEMPVPPELNKTLGIEGPPMPPGM